jgi:hypothetical protein
MKTLPPLTLEQYTAAGTDAVTWYVYDDFRNANLGIDEVTAFPAKLRRIPNAYGETFRLPSGEHVGTECFSDEPVACVEVFAPQVMVGDRVEILADIGRAVVRHYAAA